MLRHGEVIRKVGNVELEEGEGYHNITIEITTAGGIDKLLKLSESEASRLCAQISGALDQRPEEARFEMFKASIRAGGKLAPTKK